MPTFIFAGSKKEKILERIKQQHFAGDEAKFQEALVKELGITDLSQTTQQQAFRWYQFLSRQNFANYTRRQIQNSSVGNILDETVKRLGERYTKMQFICYFFQQVIAFNGIFLFSDIRLPGINGPHHGTGGISRIDRDLKSSFINRRYKK